MPKINPIDLKHTPIFLTSKDIENPFLFINQFYSQETDLEYARKELKLWFRSALSDNRLLSKNEMVSLIGFKEFLVRLVEAGFLVYNENRQEILQPVVRRKDKEPIIDPTLFLGTDDEIINAWHSFPR